MLRFLFRFLGCWLVAAALVAAVVDGAKSIAASAFVTSPLAETWETLASLGANAGQPAETSGAAATLPWLLDALLAWLLAAPTAAVLFVAGFALLVVGQRRRRGLVGREFAT